MSRRASWTSVTVAALLATCLGTFAASAADEPAPKLVVAQTTAKFEVHREKFFQDRSDVGDAVGTILISNQGTLEATDIAVSGLFANGDDFTPTLTVGGEKVAQFSLDPNEDMAVRITFEWSHEDSDTGQLVVKGSTESAATTASFPPTTVPFQIREILPASVFEHVIVWSLVIALVVMLATVLILRSGAGRPKNAPRPKLGDRIAPQKTWTFSGSWASSITALGAILGTVLAATGFLTDVVPGLSIGMFAAISLLFGFLVLLGPVVYMAFHDRDGEPTYIGLLLAAGLTVWAAIGELITSAQLVARAGLAPDAQVVPWIVVIVGILLLGAYTRTSIAQVLRRREVRMLAARVSGIAAAQARPGGAAIPDEALTAAVDAALEEVNLPVTGSAML